MAAAASAAVGRVRVDDEVTGSGFAVSARHALTAAHCVRPRRGDATPVIEFMPHGDEAIARHPHRS
jgi:V8-like Glu-specific endopeptidase